jgi:hypothetical protein
LADSNFKVIYLGGEAADHVIDMRQLGTSLIRVDKLVSDVVVALSARRLPKKGERAPFLMKAREPVAGSVEVPAILQEAAGLLPLGWQVLQTAGPEIIWNWLKAVVAYHGGDKADAEKFLDAMLELSRQAHDARDRADQARARDLDRHMQENREWRDMMMTLIERSQTAAAQAVNPVGASVTKMRIVTGGRNVDIDTPTADKIKAGDRLDIQPMREMVLRVDGFTFHNRKLSIEHPERSGFLDADVQDPIFDQDDNPYTVAAGRKARVRVQAKPGYRGDRLIKLYIMEFMEAFEDVA